MTYINETQHIVDVGENRINRLNNRFLRYIMTGGNGKKILVDFINDALLLKGDNVIETIENLPFSSFDDYAKMKLSVFDVVARRVDGRTVDVEVQFVNRLDFRKRAPYYWSLTHVKKQKECMAYVQIQPTIVICVLTFDMLDDENGYRNSFKIINEDSGRCLCDDLHIVYLELPKFCGQIGKRNIPSTGLDKWMLYFTNENGERMDNAAETKPAIALAMQLETRYWSDESERCLYDAEQRRMLDEIGEEFAFGILLEEARIEAEKARDEARRAIQKNLESLQRGVNEGKMAVAVNLLRMGVDVEKTAEATGLSVEEVENLLRSERTDIASAF
ncbi:MAG: Rpn family recombination-promoting nuclease/putative transposase [Synergistaceae bacterium]|jgi:predicted transposase/invertase (TIGR01784 family)|nr:Rpn family recombination-promoting nuclease/putative transposase [Synergistaceae bacterium]